VKRLGLEARITEYLNNDIMLPAVGQGALCIEVRREDSKVEPLMQALEDPATRSAVTCERAFLKRLEGSCQVPIAALADASSGRLAIEGLVADLNGTTVYRQQRSGPASEAESIGTALAEELLARGADRILEELKHHGQIQS
jgi:hydroxymethylbilane synthase